MNTTSNTFLWSMLIPSDPAEGIRFCVLGEYAGGRGILSIHFDKAAADHNCNVINANGGKASVEVKEFDEKRA